MFEHIAHALFQEEFCQYIFVMCHAFYAPIRLLCIDDQNKLSMDKLYYSVLHTECMITIWLEEEGDQSKRLLTDGLIFLEDTKDAAIVVFLEGSEDEDSNKNNDDVGSREVSWYIPVSNVLLCIWNGNKLMIFIITISTYIGRGRRR